VLEVADESIIIFNELALLDGDDATASKNAILLAQGSNLNLFDQLDTDDGNDSVGLQEWKASHACLAHRVLP